MLFNKCRKSAFGSFVIDRMVSIPVPLGVLMAIVTSGTVVKTSQGRLHHIRRASYAHAHACATGNLVSAVDDVLSEQALPSVSQSNDSVQRGWSCDPAIMPFICRVPHAKAALSIISDVADNII